MEEYKQFVEQAGKDKELSGDALKAWELARNVFVDAKVDEIVTALKDRNRDAIDKAILFVQAQIAATVADLEQGSQEERTKNRLQTRLTDLEALEQLLVQPDLM